MTDTKEATARGRAERIISPECAREMAEGALVRTGADVVVAVTGVGGPDPEEDEPAGTVFICAGRPGDPRVFRHDLSGASEEVAHLATLHALRHVKCAVSGALPDQL